MFDAVPKRLRIEDKYLESDELKELLESMNNPLWHIVTEFLALSGMRIGELVSLDISDVDTKSRLIHITKTYDVGARIYLINKRHVSDHIFFVSPTY